MTKTSEFFSVHQKNTCKSSLHLNLIILTDFHSFTVNEGKLQNYSIFKISAKVCALGQNLIMTKTSYFFSIQQEKTCISYHLYNLSLIIFPDFQRITVNEDEIQN